MVNFDHQLNIATLLQKVTYILLENLTSGILPALWLVSQMFDVKQFGVQQSQYWSIGRRHEIQSAIINQIVWPTNTYFETFMLSRLEKSKMYNFVCYTLEVYALELLGRQQPQWCKVCITHILYTKPHWGCYHLVLLLWVSYQLDVNN